MTFNIGSQQGGVINNVQGDQVVHGGQSSVIGSPAEALVIVQRLRHEIGGMGISGRKGTAAMTELDEIELQLDRPEPDMPTVGASLTRLAKVLASAGTLMTGGTTLVTGITALAAWLGAFGARVLDLTS